MIIVLDEANRYDWTQGKVVYMKQSTRFTPSPHLDTLIDIALSEDIGCGDATTDALIPLGQQATMMIVARESLVMCGQPVVDRLIQRFGASYVKLVWSVSEGCRVAPGTELGRFSGLLSELLVLERTVLNFLQRLSGVATHTQRFVKQLDGCSSRLVDTRKTLPGYRSLDKYATRVGGAVNHRGSLAGGVLIKDNHLRAAGGIGPAIAKARSYASHSLKIEVEVEDEAGLIEALAAGADVIMLDNFSPERVRAAVEANAGKAILEASGGINLDNIRDYGSTGVDLIAVGSLTHSAKAVDIAAEVLHD
ncbi:MAG: carboxylating nicotinate-nucleotide diphosphorylase [Myxococcota bacterium]|nr:carboxylating nicotinate-nucleotide diphosphorylase [Myxococcota bacterium]